MDVAAAYISRRAMVSKEMDKWRKQRDSQRRLTWESFSADVMCSAPEKRRAKRWFLDFIEHFVVRVIDDDALVVVW